ncbi:MAG: hypothetical protein WCQ60_02450 [bacterium]
MPLLKQNPVLVIGILLPFIFIGILIAAVFLPSWSVQPTHNFLYVTDSYENYYNSQHVYKNKIIVKDGKITLQSITATRDSGMPSYPANSTVTEAPTIFIYDVITKSSHEISLEDAQKLTVDPGPVSSDGYTISYKYNNEGIFSLFGANNSQGYFVTKGDTSRRLAGLAAVEYPYSFHFLAWIQ